jgi:sugar phosphate isomerase/epimerase
MGNIHLREVLRRCDENSIDSIELSAPHPYQPLEKLKKLLLEYRRRGFRFTIHNYFPPQKRNFVLNIASLDENIRRQSRNLVEEALELASEIDSPVYGIHMGYLAEGNVDPKGIFQFKPKKNNYGLCLEQMALFVKDIAKKSQNYGITIILENLFPGKTGNFSLGCTFDEIEKIISMVPEQVGLLLDLGHLNVSSHMFGFDKFAFLEKCFAKFGDLIYEVHLSENEGLEDEHLPITENSWQLMALKDFCGIPLRKNRSRIFCLEARNEVSLDSLKSSIELINKYIDYF